MDIVPLMVTTNASGAGTVTAARGVDVDTAKVLTAVEWVDGTFADGVDAVLSVTNTLSGVDKTLLTLTNANTDAWYYPVSAVHNESGSALASYVRQIVNGDLRLVVSSGGSATAGGAYLYLE